jgi:hypothetical protein
MNKIESKQTTEINIFVDYVLREGRRGNVGSVSWRKFLSNFLVGDEGPLTMADCDSVDRENEERCAFDDVSADSWLTRMGERYRSKGEGLKRTRETISMKSSITIKDSR